MALPTNIYRYHEPNGNLDTLDGNRTYISLPFPCPCGIRRIRTTSLREMSLIKINKLLGVEFVLVEHLVGECKDATKTRWEENINEVKLVLW